MEREGNDVDVYEGGEDDEDVDEGDEIEEGDVVEDDDVDEDGEDDEGDEDGDDSGCRCFWKEEVRRQRDWLMKQPEYRF